MKTFIATVALMLAAASAWGLINATLQPDDLYQRYQQVLVGRIVSIDEAKSQFELELTDVVKSARATDVKRIKVTAEGEGVEAFKQSVQNGTLAKGESIVAFIGGGRRRGADQLLFYVGGWGIGKQVADDQWQWLRGDEQMIGTDGKAVPAMAGVWNGSTDQLAKMLADIKADRSFFPRRAYARFRDDMLIDTFDRAISGVGLVDFDGDGDLDLYACSDGGDRMYLQMEPLVFVNATDYLGMETASLSCSFADVDGDGRPDLLADGMLYANRVDDEGKPQVVMTEWMPYAAADSVKAAAFVELNGDGWPDVLIASSEGGLRAWLHTGARADDGKPLYVQGTKKLGLDRPSTGAGEVGFITAGDWNGDGRTDLFFAAGSGYLLIQQADGRFEPLAHDLRMDFRSGQEGEAGLTGASCFAPVIHQDRFDLVVPVESGWHVIANADGKPRDVTRWGNEVSEGSYLHLATIANDWNLDGCVDFYTIARGENGQNRYIINRGYGSFMLASVNRAYDRMFQGAAHQRGGAGVAAGDINGDGQSDLLIGNERGELLVTINDTLSKRRQDEHLPQDERILAQTQLVTVDLGEQRGVVGATVKLLSKEGRTVAMRFIGTNIATGCQSARKFTMAVREPGPYTLHVRFGDGVEVRMPVDLTSGRYTAKPLFLSPKRP